jgi:hypothetical protein
LLESVIQTLAGSLVHEDQRIARIITAELSFSNLRALTTSLYRERYGKSADYNVLRAQMKRARELEELRNQITHSVWAAGDTPETVTRIKTTAKEKHGLRFDFQKVSGQDLGKVADDIKQLAGEIQQFWMNGFEQ